MPAPIAILLEAARPAEMAPLLADVYGLTPHKRRVTECVPQGLPTRHIANQLQMSTYTVQDHLKSIFSKTEPDPAAHSLRCGLRHQTASRIDR